MADIKDFDSINPDLFEALEKEAKSKPENMEDGIDNNLSEIVNDTIESTDGEIEVEAEKALNPVDEETVESIASEYKEHDSSEEEMVDEGAKVIPFSG